MNKSEIYREQILDHYQKGLSISKISKLLSISQPTISKVIKQAGIDIRKDNYQKIKLDTKEINRLYDSGMSTYEIAEALKCSDETIRKYVINMRSESERNIKTEEDKLKHKQISTAKWQDEEYRSKVKASTNTQEYKLRLAQAATENYNTTLGKWIQSNEAKNTISSNLKSLWADETYRTKILASIYARLPDMINASKKALSNPAKRAEWIDKIRRNNVVRQTSPGWISTAQKQLYYILQSSKILFHEEGPNTKVGPFYVVDCVIPIQQSMSKPLIIKVQGEYWHSLSHVKIKDRQKETYIRNHTDYDLISLEELHLASFGEVKQKLANYGLDISSIQCSVKDIIIKPIEESQASMFYSIFHYTGSIRKGAIAFGAYYNDELMAAISYCPPIRQEVGKRLGYAPGEIYEISRLSRRTNFICKNLLSYFISQTKKLLPKKVKCLVSYSDATYDHKGTVYKASGFVCDGIVSPDYYYVSINGKYHKKTIWDRAKRMKMNEAEYAAKHNLMKVVSKEKTRWIMEL